MRAVVIDVAQLGGPTLFSPTAAHALQRTDLVLVGGQPRRVTTVRLFTPDDDMCEAHGFTPGAPLAVVELEPLPLVPSHAISSANKPVLRAVGGRAGGVL
jgi:hypothetical protein